MKMNLFVFALVLLFTSFMGSIIPTTIGKILIVPFAMFAYGVISGNITHNNERTGK